MIAEAILSAVLSAAALIPSAPAKCPPPEGYPTSGPLPRYVVSATVDACDICPGCGCGAVCDDWGFEYYYQGYPDLYDGQRVTLIYNDSGTPDDLADDVLEDILYSCPPGSPCHDD